VKLEWQEWAGERWCRRRDRHLVVTILAGFTVFGAGIYFESVAICAAAMLPIVLAGLLATDAEQRARSAANNLARNTIYGDRYAVEIYFQVVDEPDARDQGVLWVFEGRLRYEGLRTRFEALPEQVIRLVRRRPLHHQTELALQDAHLRIEELALYRNGQLEPSGPEVSDALSDWLRAFTAARSGSQLQ
jgi:hypothetical protein